MPPEEKKEAKKMLMDMYIKLHGMLGDFQMLLARHSTPTSFDSEECKAISYVMELVERETAKTQKIIV